MVKRKQLSENHTVIFSEHFPYICSTKQQSNAPYRALLGIGGNVGDVLRRFEHLYWYFKKSKNIHIIETAPILKNPPFGYTNQDDFYNSLILVQTRLSAQALLRYILRVEKHFGRKRLFKDGPRTLDIDIIFYENIKINTETLTLPHSGWKERMSVLVPLSYMRNTI